MPVAAMGRPDVPQDQDVAIACDPAFEVRVERRLTDKSGVIYITVNASSEVTVNGEVVA